MSQVRTSKLMGPELTEMKIRMDSNAHLNVYGSLETGISGQICLPSGTTDERPTSPQKGMIRINETKLGIEVYDGSDWLLITQPPVGGAGGGETSVSGQEEYTSGGTYSWTCPENVFEVSVVCVGGGGGSTRDEQGAAGGGGLGWISGFQVSPGTSYDVVVGSGGQGQPSSGNYGYNGGTSYFNDMNTVYGQGGGGTGRDENGSANRPGYGGKGGGHGGSGGTSQGGGNGGNGGDGNRSSLSDTGTSCCGGGAGGYSGNGGNGGHCSQYAGGNSGWSGNGGGGSGGWTNGGEDYGGGGGGVGLKGEGTSGQSPSSNNCGGGYAGSGGSNGQGSCGSNTAVNGGVYGGGGGSNDAGGWPGGVGGVRILWGPDRAYPSTNTDDV